MNDGSPPGGQIERMIQAIRQGAAGEVQLLVDSNPALAAARDTGGVSALVLALYHGQRDLARWLADRRTDLDLFEAAAMGDDRRVESLVSATPTLVEARSPDGFTALALAAFFGHLAVVRLLLDRGADPHAVGGAQKYTALTGAVTAGHAAVVGELLSHGADANYRYGPGYSPLHIAAANGNAEIVRMLLEAGADASAKTEDGQTPRDFAVHRGQQDVARILEEAERRRRANA